MMKNKNITLLEIVSPEEFKESFLKDIRAELKSLVQHLQPVEPPEYLTRREAAKLLKVSMVTLTDWNNKGILNPYRIGNLIRYRRSELDQALKQINNRKNQ